MAKKLVGGFTKKLLEVGFPGSEEDVEITSPSTTELGKDEKDQEEIFDRTEMICSGAGITVFDGQDQSQATRYGDLKLKFLNAKKPKKPTDPPAYVCTKEETTFTKDGLYLIAVHWSIYSCIAIKDTFEGEIPDGFTPKSV